MREFGGFVFARTLNPIIFVEANEEPALIVESATCEVADGSKDEIPGDSSMEEMAVVVAETIESALPKVSFVAGGDFDAVRARESE